MSCEIPTEQTAHTAIARITRLMLRQSRGVVSPQRAQNGSGLISFMSYLLINWSCILDTIECKATTT